MNTHDVTRVPPQPEVERESPELDRFVPTQEVQRIFGGKSRTTIWRWERDGIIPKSHKLGPNSKGWSASSLRDCIAQLKAEVEN